MLQVAGLLVGSVAGYMIYPAVGGLILSAGLFTFGLALEKSGDV